MSNCNIDVDYVFTGTFAEYIASIWTWISTTSDLNILGRFLGVPKAYIEYLQNHNRVQPGGLTLK